MLATTPCLEIADLGLISITSPWPFAQWGINIVGPLPIALASKKLLLVAIDYFSKWIEAEAFMSIKDKDVIQSSGGILFAGLVYPAQLCLTMDLNLTAGHTGTEKKEFILHSAVSAEQRPDISF